MGLHLYCIVPADHAPPAQCKGVGEVVVATIEITSDLWAWVTHHGNRPVASLANVRAHNDVALAAMSPNVTPVPLRFGQWLASAADAASRAAEQAGEWRALLERLHGHVEFGVTATFPDPARDERSKEQDVHAGSSGTAYMHALAGRQRTTSVRQDAAARLVAACEDAVSSLVADTRVDMQRIGEGTVSIAYLVAWNSVRDYDREIRAAAGRCGDTRYLFTGPWPPYSFVQ